MWNINTIIICFFIYCVLGWCCEEVYCYLLSKKWVNRGFLYGPYLPIYGSGAMAVVLLLENFLYSPALIFLLGMTVCSLIEYVAHWGMEKIFNIKLWDYSTYHFNLNGRICLRNSTLFGICSLLVMYVINVPLLGFVFRLNDYAAYSLSVAIVVLLSVDTVFSVIKLNAFKKAMLELDKLSKELNERSIEYFSKSFEEFSKNRADFEERLRFEIEMKKSAHDVEREKAIREISERMDLVLGKMRFILRDNPSLTNREKGKSDLILNAREQIQTRRKEIKSKITKAKMERKNGTA
ncbi:MAG: putative ABC transporter permease [Sphaerochaetaceae bacterium]|nr:putative ABC transporter permease [Sphaerochaetaceae bacterium]